VPRFSKLALKTGSESFRGLTIVRGSSAQFCCGILPGAVGRIHIPHSQRLSPGAFRRAWVRGSLKVFGDIAVAFRASSAKAHKFSPRRFEWCDDRACHRGAGNQSRPGGPPRPRRTEGVFGSFRFHFAFGVRFFISVPNRILRLALALTPISLAPHLLAFFSAKRIPPILADPNHIWQTTANFDGFSLAGFRRVIGCA